MFTDSLLAETKQNMRTSSSESEAVPPTAHSILTYIHNIHDYMWKPSEGNNTLSVLFKAATGQFFLQIKGLKSL